MPTAHHTPVRRRGALAMAALLAVPVWSNAQTDGTWAVDVGTAGGNWSDPNNWVGGIVASQGGMATFPQLRFSSQPLQIYQDLPTVELSGLNFTGPFNYLLRPAPATTNSLTLTGPAVIHTALPQRWIEHRIQLPIHGSSGLTKTGPGVLRLEAASSFTGAVNILGGTVFAEQSPDAVFGDPGNQINLGDATLRIGSTWATSRTINLLGSGTIAISSFGSASITLNGPITGAGGLNVANSNPVYLTAHNTYSGPTRIVEGGFWLREDGAIPNTTSFTIFGGIGLDNRSVNHTDRVSDSAAVMIYSGGLSFLGNNNANSSEQLGPVTVTGGVSTFSIRPSSFRTATLSMETLFRENGAVAFFGGRSLGAAPGNNVSNVMLQQPPPLVGGGGAAGSTNMSIIPWAFGNSSTLQTDAHLPTSSLVTYGPTGVRPLNINTEYASTLAAAGATDNVRLVASEELTAPATVNAMVLVNSLKLLGPGTLTISSGMLLSVGTATSGKEVRAPLNFGNAEAIILTPSDPTRPSPITLSGSISGSGGLTKQGDGTAVFNAASTYTGTTRIGGGAALFVSDVPASGPGPFGSDTSPIVFTGDARLVYAGTGTGTFNRDLLVGDPADPTDPADFPDLSPVAGSNLVMNGNINLQSSLALRSRPQSTVTLAGTISGDGMLSDRGSSIGSTIIITGDNTFTGSVRMGQAVWALGSDTALGTGVIPGGKIRAHGGPRTIANDVLGGPNVLGDQPITFTGSMDLGGLLDHGIQNSALTTYAGTLHSGGLEKYGQGTLLLSGDNVYTGPTIVTEGVLRVAHANALGTTDSPTTVRHGAGLEITGGTQSSEPVIASGAGFLGQGAIRSFGGHNMLGDLTGAIGQLSVHVVEDSLTVADVQLPPTVDLRKDGPGHLAARRYRGGGVQVLEGTVAVTPGRSQDKTSVLLLLNVDAPDARFDLADNDLVWDYFLSTQLASARLRIGTAYADGAWTGAGITSSLADQSTFALGYAESTEIFTTFPADFSGVLVDDTAVLVRFTRYGDANLDGIVNLRDFNRLAANFGAGDAVWSQGDFNYDGIVNLADFNLLAGGFGLSAAGPDVSAGDWAALAAAVPEPAGAAACAPLLMLAAPRPRRRPGPRAPQIPRPMTGRSRSAKSM